MTRVEGRHQELPRAQSLPQTNVAPKASEVPAGAPSTVAVFGADGMAEAQTVALPQVAIMSSGLHDGATTSLNPFQAMMAGLPPELAIAVLRLSEASIGLEIDLTPGETQLGKLAGFEKLVFSAPQVSAGQQAGFLQSSAKVREGFMVNLNDALPPDGQGGVSLAQLRSEIAGLLAAEAGSERAPTVVSKAMLARKSSFPNGMDVHSFVQAVLRESYLFHSDQLREKGERLKATNLRRRGLREEKRRAQGLRSQIMSGDGLSKDDYEELSTLLGIDIIRSEEDSGKTEKLAKFEGGKDAPVLDLGAEPSVIEEVLNQQIAKFDDAIATEGEDAELMRMELQDLLQKQQQALSMMTNMSKMMHDLAMSIIRNIGG